jgi:hypothetical protein
LLVRVACRKCDRVGKYSVAKLIERHGPEAKLWTGRTRSLPIVRRAKDRIAFNDACGAHFPDLVPLFVARDS